MFSSDGNRLIYRHDGETLWIEPWGPNALRVRATPNHTMPAEDWALDESVPQHTAHISLPPSDAVRRPDVAGGLTSPGPDDASSARSPSPSATIRNGALTATVTWGGKLTMHRRDAHTGEDVLVLEEYARNRTDLRDPKCSALDLKARDFVPLTGNDNYALTMRFESLSRKERLFGMGQYQQASLDLKGADLEMAHRNSQASVPFLLSSLGYGLLWNNPAVGRAVLGMNVMSFEARSTPKLDYWVVVSETNEPMELVQAYVRTTGLPPPMPEYGLGFWQCKLRYQTQDEVLQVARTFKEKKLPLDVLVIDFFHWPAQGTWRFDPDYWPDPSAMVAELRAMGVETMVSVWPTVEQDSENWDEMVDKGLLIRTDRGMRAAMDFQGLTCHFDATNPAARDYVWQRVRENYVRHGIKLFWLDEAEPEYKAYDFDHYRYHLGPDLAVGNLYPRLYSRAFYDGAKALPASETPGGGGDGSSNNNHGTPNLVNLVRCAWAGSQKYGALVWSGDIASSWPSLRAQLSAGLNMAIAGIPYWTTDIGGFHGGDPADPAFRELLVRWFQWGCFLPVMRLHGDRHPSRAPLGPSGGGRCFSGNDNEPWSFGPAAGAVLEKYMRLRERMRGYVRATLREASEKGTPVIRALFLAFARDPAVWDVDDQYMFGSRYLVCPVLVAGARTRTVYFPAGARWRVMEGEATYEGGTTVEVDAPLETMPVFEML